MNPPYFELGVAEAVGVEVVGLGAEEVGGAVVVGAVVVGAWVVAAVEVVGAELVVGEAVPELQPVIMKAHTSKTVRGINNFLILNSFQ